MTADKRSHHREVKRARAESNEVPPLKWVKQLGFKGEMHSVLQPDDRRGNVHTPQPLAKVKRNVSSEISIAMKAKHPKCAR